MPFSLLTGDIKGYSQCLLMLSLVTLEPVQFELQILLLVQQLLQPIGQDDIGVVQAAVLLVELVVRVVFQVVTTVRRLSIFLHVVVQRLTLLLCRPIHIPHVGPRCASHLLLHLL